MKESQFIKDNEDDWRKLEALLAHKNKDADQLLQLFEKVSGDLAYARTFYPNRSVRLYLNNLTQKVLNTLETRPSKFKFQDILDFYKTELPSIVYEHKNAFLTSLFVFVIAVIIGALSTIHIPEFLNIIVGDEYVNITEENINKGDPMAIYKDPNDTDMLMRITINNIKVSFICFILGIIGSVGTIFILLSNGIMLGAFQTYFYTKGLFFTSFLTIWIHGTIEISAIIIAGAAGIILGNGLLFPKSYNRNISLLISSKKALKVILGIIPLFVIAGFLESFVTRLTDLPTVVKLLIIGVSLFFILLVFVIYPWRYARSYVLTQIQEPEPVLYKEQVNEKYIFRNIGETLSVAFGQMRKGFGQLFYHATLPTSLIMIAAYYLIIKFKILTSTGLTFSLKLNHFTMQTWLTAALASILITYTLIVLMMIYNGDKLDLQSKLIAIKKYFLKLLPIVLLYYVGFGKIPGGWAYIFLAVIPIHILFIFAEQLISFEKNYIDSIRKAFQVAYKEWMNFLPILLILYLMALAITSFIALPVNQVVNIISEFISWHNIFDNQIADKVFTKHVMGWIAGSFFLLMTYCLLTYRYTSVDSHKESYDLYKKLDQFGNQSNVFEAQ